MVQYSGQAPSLAALTFLPTIQSQFLRPKPNSNPMRNAYLFQTHLNFISNNYFAPWHIAHSSCLIPRSPPTTRLITYIKQHAPISPPYSYSSYIQLSPRSPISHTHHLFLQLSGTVMNNLQQPKQGKHIHNISLEPYNRPETSFSRHMSHQNPSQDLKHLSLIQPTSLPSSSSSRHIQVFPSLL